MTDTLPDDLAAHQPSVDWLLTTTRSVRKRLDLEREVPREVILDCLRMSTYAPTGSNSQGWRWIVVTDADKRRALADLYAGVGRAYLAMAKDSITDDPQTTRVYESALYLADHLHEVPVHVIPCIYGRPDASALGGGSLYGSIVPAIWSFQLALRSRGLGSCYTTLHLGMEQQANELLGIPDDVTQVALLPVAWTKGTEFRAPARRPVEEITYWDGWKA